MKFIPILRKKKKKKKKLKESIINQSINNIYIIKILNKKKFLYIHIFIIIVILFK